MKVILEIDIPDRKIKDMACRANPGMDMKCISLNIEEMRSVYEESVRFSVEHALKYVFGVAEVEVISTKHKKDGFGSDGK